MKRLQAWLLCTILATFALITIGATVRATGSGLGCPDWPRCFGEWIPPTDASQVKPPFKAEDVNIAKTWTEYLNRVAGVLVGMLMLISTFLGWKNAKHRRDIAWLITAALLLTIFQGWQGGKVVEAELDPRFVTLHLLVALGILALLILPYLRLRSAPPRPVHSDNLKRAKSWTKKALGVALMQFVAGALLRGSIELVAKEQPLLKRVDWTSEAGLVGTVHAVLGIALFVTVFQAYVAAKIADVSDHLYRKLVPLSLLIVGIQLFTGFVLTQAALPPILQVVHISLASWLVMMLFVIDRLLARALAL